MCQIFVRANPQSYEATTRSIRLHGVVTSVRLENLFWDTLEEIGQRDGLSVPQLLSVLCSLRRAAGASRRHSQFFKFLAGLRFALPWLAAGSPHPQRSPHPHQVA
jgi:predicted DNA-binding ribbon-helix-helix protein